MKIYTGISVYPTKSSIEESLAYIERAYKHGFSRVFTSILDTKVDTNVHVANLQKITQLTKRLGMELIVDVNPEIYTNFKLAKDDLTFFHKLGIDGIRLDEDFGGEMEAKLSNNKIGMKIELNASAGTKTFDNALRNNANPANLIACHNFYPMRYTGLAYPRFLELSRHYRAQQIRVAAFITLPQDQKGTCGAWDYNNGMPTIEEHRYLCCLDQTRHLVATNVITDIIISTQGASDEQFAMVNRVLKKQEVILVRLSKKVKNLGAIEEKIIFHYTHEARPDYCSAFAVRSTFSRITFKDESIKPRPSRKEFFEPGDVIIMNDNATRYKGEVHIVTKKIPTDNERNFVGTIREIDHLIIPFIWEKASKFEIIE